LEAEDVGHDRVIVPVARKVVSLAAAVRSSFRTRRAKPLALLATMLVGVTLYSHLASYLNPLFGLSEENDQYLLNKWLLAGLLLGIVIFRGEVRASGLVARANWRTLPLYWPLALIAGMIWLGSTWLPSPLQALKIFLWCVAVGLTEELMFRGLVFHWFRAVSIRKIIVISAVSFGGVHLIGLASEIHPAVVLSQVFFACALGLIFACARARDTSIVLPIAAHALFDFLAIGPHGTVSRSFENVEQVVAGMLVSGSIALAWGLFLLRRTDSGLSRPVRNPPVPAEDPVRRDREPVRPARGP